MTEIIHSFDIEYHKYRTDIGLRFYNYKGNLYKPSWVQLLLTYPALDKINKSVVMGHLESFNIDLKNLNGETLTTRDGIKTEFLFCSTKSPSRYSLIDTGENRAIAGKDYHVQILCAQSGDPLKKDESDETKSKRKWWFF